jgi:drug/metabolite transporter (DMT)-like permease
MTNHKRSLFEIHLAVFLFGLSGLLGKMISLSPLVIVFGRTFFASATLLVLIKISKKTIRIHSPRDMIVLIALGVLLAFHWFSFFQSIKLSTVAIGLITFSTFPLFVTFMEPYFFREKLSLFSVFMAALVFAGIYLVIPSFDITDQVTQGVIWGVLSGLSFAVLSLLNRKYVSSYPSSLIAFFQNSIAALVLLPLIIVADFSPQPMDYFLLPFLGVFCTAAAHTLFIKSLKGIKTQLASLIACLEPVYGIFLALVILGETPGMKTWAGGVIILGTIFLATIRRKQVG